MIDNVTSISMREGKVSSYEVRANQFILLATPELDARGNSERRVDVFSLLTVTWV